MKRKLFKLLLLFFGCAFAVTNATAQANAYINIITQNSGQVTVGGTVFIEVTVGNTGPVSPIGVNKVRAQISVPSALVSIPATGHVLPTGWTITVNTGSAITVCNGTDVIPVGAARTILISVQGNTIGGPSTVTGNLLFSSGTSCTAPGSLPGDNTADNSSTTSIQVVQGCPLSVTASAGTIVCNSGTTTLTATPTGATGAVEFSITGGATFQAGNTFTIPAGTYTVTAREVSNPGCTANSGPVTVSEPAAVPAPIFSVANPTCTVSTGTITITSPTTGLSFSLDGGPYATYPAGGYIVIPGAHTLSAQNISNCISAIANITVNAQPSIPAAPTVTVTDPTCTVATGTIVITSGTAALTFSLDGAPYAAYPAGGYTGLAVGAHTLTAQNSSGCNSAVTNCTINPQPATPSTPTVSIVQPTCTVATGTITVTSITTGLIFSLDGGAYSTYPVGGYNGVIPGTHTLTSQNSSGCISAASNIIVNNQPATPAAPTIGTITQPTCAISTGSVVLTGLPAGNWIINPSTISGNTASVTLNGLAAGTYAFTVTNSFGCTSAASINLIIDPVPGAPAAPVVNAIQPSCTVPTGTIIVTSATTGLTFSFDGGAYAAYPAGGYAGVATGAHTLTLQNASNCVSPVTNIVVNVQPVTPAAPAVNITHPTCTLATGIITVTSVTTALTFSLDGGAYSAYPAGGFTGVVPGTHTLTAQNGSGCISAITNLLVNAQPATPVPPTVGAITQPTCAVITGSVVLSALPAGNWTINPGSVSGSGASTTVNGLIPGTYNFSVTNSAGCTSAVSANVIIDPVSGTPPSPTISIIQPSCTLATGTIAVTSSTAGLTFSLDGGPYSAYPAGGYIVAVGTHTLTAQNAANCLSPVTNIVINAQPATPASPTTTITQPTCTLATGIISITSTTAGLTFSLDGGAYSAYPAGGYTNIPAGAHTLTAQNSSGCISTLTNITVNPQPATPATPTVNVIQPTCTISTGTLTISSATVGLTFSFDGGAYAVYPAGGYTSITPGTHTLTAQNTSNCISAPTNIIVNNQPPIPAAPAVNVTQPSCSSATGIITITSATTGLTFSLDGGNYSSYPVGGYTGVAAGLHTLTAQNSVGCISTATNITVNPPPAAPSATASAGSITCFGGSTVLTVSASGGTPPYQYSLNGGAFQASNTFTIGAGSYTVTVRGVNLCTTNAIVSVTQPAAIAVSATAGLIPCKGGTSTITSNASGGTSPFQYSINGGAFQTGNTFIVGAGVYAVTVRDANLCTKTAASITVTEPAVLTALVTAPRILTCGGTTLVKVTPSGGRAPFTGAGDFIKGPGTWSFTVTDAGGCSAVASITIEAPGCLNLEVFPNPAKNSISINHSVAEPGSLIQIFEINGAKLMSKAVVQNAFLTTIDISKLSIGTYILVFINGNDKKSALFEKLTY